MSKTRPPLTPALTRRAALAGLAVAFAAPALAASEDAAVSYMQKVAKDMLAAHRQGTVASFKRAILRHADVPSIADYSLGQYRSKLSPTQKQAYYSGTATFMARYFADQSRDYVVSKYEIGDADADGNDVNVDTKVYLMNGQSYTVVWRLGKARWRLQGRRRQGDGLLAHLPAARHLHILPVEARWRRLATGGGTEPLRPARRRHLPHFTWMLLM